MPQEILKSSVKPITIPFAAVALLSVGLLFSCTKAEQKSDSPPEKATIAYSATTDAVLAEVAQKLGYYREEGLEAIPHLHPFGKPALKEVLEGKADFATVAETPVMFAIMRGAKIAVIATIETSSRDNAIIARKDRGILTFHDLKGRKVAVTLGTTSDFFLDTILATHDLSRKDIKVVDVKAEEMSDALARGDIDAVSTFNPYIIQTQRKLGARGITFHDDDIYSWTFNIVATEEFIRKNPGKVRKLLRALVKAEEFTRQNPAEAQKIVADFSGVERDIVRDIWADTNYRVSLDQALVLALEDESRWAIKSGLIGAAKIPNYLNFIYFDGLEAVKPKAVRILR